MDAAASPIPGAATSWSVAPDGKTWTFHLRDHLWSDGRNVTAQDFVFAWQRLLDPKTGAAYAYNLWVVKNAHAISEGKLPPSALGVRAADDRTLVVELEHPAAYLPELLTHDTAYPLPRHVLLAKGNAWSMPRNFVGNAAVCSDAMGRQRPPHSGQEPEILRRSACAHRRGELLSDVRQQRRAAAISRRRVGHADTYSIDADRLASHAHAGGVAHQAVPGTVLYFNQHAPRTAQRRARAACAQPRPRPRNPDGEGAAAWRAAGLQHRAAECGELSVRRGARFSCDANTAAHSQGTVVDAPSWL